MNYVYLLFLLLLALPTATHAHQDVSAFKRGRMRGDSLRTELLRRIEDARPDYNADSVRAVIESGPYFGIFRDNYFIGGIPIGGPVRRDNANVKFQISIIHRLTKSRLPFDTYLFLQFTQKTIWNVLWGPQNEVSKGEWGKRLRDREIQKRGCKTNCPRA